MLFELFTKDFIEYYKTKLMEYVKNERYSITKVNKVNYEENLSQIIFEDGTKFSLLNSLCSCKEGRSGAKCKHSNFLASENYF